MMHARERERYVAACQFLTAVLKSDTVPHTNRTLFDHLVGTHLLLKVNKEREEVCLAGLFHSVYGTEHFRHKSLDATSILDREIVRGVIGDEAEALAYLFCTLPTRPQCFFRSHEVAKPMTLALHWRDLQAIELANLIEQGGLTAVTRYM